MMGVLKLGLDDKEYGDVEFLPDGNYRLHPKPGFEGRLRTLIEGMHRHHGAALEGVLEEDVGRGDRNRRVGAWVEFADGRPHPDKLSEERYEPLSPEEAAAHRRALERQLASEEGAVMP